MKNKKLLLTLLVASWSICHVSAQLISNADIALIKNENQFDEKFIRSNQIKTISGKVSMKKELQPINDIGTLIEFRFNANGKLDEKVTTSFNYLGQRDTNSIRYQYDDIYRLIGATERTNGGFETVKYRYNEDGSVAQKDKYKGENLSQYKYQLQQGKSFRISGDSLEYIELDSNKTLIHVFNEQGLRYKSLVLTYNPLGLPEKEIERFSITNNRKETLYVYNDFGQLSEVKITSNIGVRKEERFVYSYQEDGNIYDEKYFKNGILLTRREFLYDSNTSLLKAELIKKQKLNDIKIIQYTYEFFGEETNYSEDTLSVPVELKN